jgi:hypothetical protein
MTLVSSWISETLHPLFFFMSGGGGSRQWHEIKNNSVITIIYILSIQINHPQIKFIHQIIFLYPCMKMKQPNFDPIRKNNKKKQHDYDNVMVCIPTHSSALSTIFPSQENCQHPAEMMISSLLEKEDDDNDDKIETIRSNSNNTQPTSFCRDISGENGGDRLYIQCHYDRIIWNFFHPLFVQKDTTTTATTTAAAMHAIEIIIHAFETCIIKQQQQQQLSSPSRYWNHSMAKKDTKNKATWEMTQRRRRQ